MVRTKPGTKDKNLDPRIHPEISDPDFTLLQQQARVFGLEVIKMADAGVLPYNYSTYASEIQVYLQTAKKKAAEAGLKVERHSPHQTLDVQQRPCTSATRHDYLLRRE